MSENNIIVSQQTGFIFRRMLNSLTYFLIRTTSVSTRI